MMFALYMAVALVLSSGPALVVASDREWRFAGEVFAWNFALWGGGLALTYWFMQAAS